MSQNFIPDGYRMLMGNEVLHALATDYPDPQAPAERLVRIKEHTIDRVMACLGDEAILLPQAAQWPTGFNAADLFCGYLLLDALISNQDRHHENWAIMQNERTGERYLCPTYDHAASLGREMRDEERIERLATRDKNRQILAFVNKARSELFLSPSDKKPLLTVDAFNCAGEIRPEARKYWLRQLINLSDACIVGIFARVPDACISASARHFACEMVKENKKRLLQYDR
ncbi:MAG: hypothetical protein ACRCZA_03880 [Shewanella sp.]|uniref:hypothetical protein n=1 Tax=Shewanella sp. TaxID=50422 RepID=UPI003F3C08EF